eukprot:CAMPEP_0116055798 /NCGR_PEP_ID=MMETSP0322-20121206/3621_1 /TAXON_ID=163516 /ORGANISM="Leptocylindrus danicus var. apora, Strain B651" /LENGTH=523 /DNA_ID=CAMNT_0003539469 /DNA_START=397 /DNA_END=1969 /DNA_ORIENTATION=-
MALHLLKRKPDTSQVSKATLISAYLRQRAILCMSGIQTVASEASLHFPPAGPALLLLAFAPRTRTSRRLVFASLSLALMSWGHDELTRVRRTRKSLVACGLYSEEPKLLPPFLQDDDLIAKTTSNHTSSSSSFLKNNTYWLAMQDKVNVLKTQRAYQQSMKDKEELLAIRSLKGKSRARNSYALVTGASRGLGRALAVELARRDKNLILVARDLERLNKLASDLEQYYGVQCHVIEADLSQTDTPQKIHNATSRYGLNVDIVINNAGLSSTTEFVDEDVDFLQTILQVNALSVAKLSRLYLGDMKSKRSGAILFVSSITGLVPALPSAAIYAATKSFERSLALGLSKEVSKYGIAVTLLSPGCISDTEFAKRGQMNEGLCWSIPYYPRSSMFIAKAAINSLSEGKLECIPGWQNRFLVRVMKPLLPQKMLMDFCQTLWQPLQKSLPVYLGGEMPLKSNDDDTYHSSLEHGIEMAGGDFEKPPQMLTLRENDKPEFEVPNQINETEKINMEEENENIDDQVIES